MEKRHFPAIAKIIQLNKPDFVDSWTKAHWDTLVDGMADYLSQTNSRFDRDRFIKACNE